MTRRARTVWKYTIPVQDDPVSIVMPQDSELLHFDTQNGDPAVIECWALVDPEPGAHQLARTFIVRGTGHPVPDGVVHRGTIVHKRFALVWHVFEVIA